MTFPMAARSVLSRLNCKCFTKFQVKKEGLLSEDIQGLVRKSGPQEHPPPPSPTPPPPDFMAHLALPAALELDAVILPLLSMGDGGSGRSEDWPEATRPASG